MIDISVISEVELIAFWLCFTRLITISIQLPIFDNKAVPMMVKTLFTLIITYAFFPFVKGSIIKEVVATGTNNFWILTMFHTVVGLMIGFFVKNILHIFASSGNIMTQQIGFGNASYFDPTFEMRSGPIEKMIQWTMLILILTSGALIPMFKGALSSFSTVTFLALGKFSASHIFYFDFFKNMFSTAILLATPILFVNLLLNLVLGIVARMIPQMNILMVSFVVNIGIGLVVFLAIMNEYFNVAFDVYLEQLGNWFQFLQ